jgi:hypothetical protein
MQSFLAYLDLSIYHVWGGRDVPKELQADVAKLALHAVQTPEMTIGGSPILPEHDVGLYGRSVTFVPESPSLPANFR